MITLFAICALIGAYLLGALPTGLLLCRWIAGVDIREHGSGNIGFTNAARVLGWWAAVPVLVIDVLKAYAAPAWFPLMVEHPPFPHFAIALGVAALLGNLVNVFIGFKGGKGVAASLGVFLALAPIATLAALGTFLLMVAIFRYVSLGSVSAAAVLPIVTFVVHGWSLIFVITLLLGLTVIIRHQSNIRKLLRGEEDKVTENPDPIRK
ncbi:glycerol-3-phosphate 1-O-acyltransferase PlsY [bacterium]|nr:glycerol-3-phosphate 1-O-acyltransferase PlsY [bacterium]